MNMNTLNIKKISHLIDSVEELFIKQFNIYSYI